MMRTWPIVAVAASVLGVIASGAEGATVSLGPVISDEANGYTLSYTAGAGEANRLAADVTAGGDAWTFRDAGARIEPGSNCAAAADGAVTCTAPATIGAPLTGHVVIDLGDGNDVADLGARHASVAFDAGSGDDALLVRSGFVDAAMGPGDDQARADAGGLQVEGGPGADRSEAGPWADLGVSYFQATTGVRVSTDGAANDGAPGEHDDVSPHARTVYGSVGDDILDAGGARVKVSLYGNAGDDRLFASSRGGGLAGGEGDDVLRGGDGRDFLDGDAGDDQLLGGGGADALSGGTGGDLLVGGPGRDDFVVDYDGRGDSVRARDGIAERIVCTFVPSHLLVDPVDRLTHCAFPVVISSAPQLAADRRLRVTLRCPWLAPGGCRGTIVVIDSGPEPLARVPFAVGAGRTRRVSMRLRHRPRELQVAALIVNRRARPPASERTTVSMFALVAR